MQKADLIFLLSVCVLFESFSLGLLLKGSLYSALYMAITCACHGCTTAKFEMCVDNSCLFVFIRSNTQFPNIIQLWLINEA